MIRVIPSSLLNRWDLAWLTIQPIWICILEESWIGWPVCWWLKPYARFCIHKEYLEGAKSHFGEWHHSVLHLAIPKLIPREPNQKQQLLHPLLYHRTMDLPVCCACGTQYDSPSGSHPSNCKICDVSFAIHLFPLSNSYPGTHRSH